VPEPVNCANRFAVIRIRKKGIIRNIFTPELIIFSSKIDSTFDAEDVFYQVIEAAALLGAKSYTFHGPANVKQTRKLLNYQRIAETAGALADKAINRGIKLAWENVYWCWYSMPDFASSLLNMPQTANLYFTLDLKQAAQAGYNPVDFIKHTKGKLVNIHICDYSISENNVVYPVLPFKGNIDFNEIKNALYMSGYNNALLYEVYSNNYSCLEELEENYNKFTAFFSGK
jgi:sugar phosphate isomerase/epimerase